MCGERKSWKSNTTGVCSHKNVPMFVIIWTLLLSFCILNTRPEINLRSILLERIWSDVLDNMKYEDVCAGEKILIVICVNLLHHACKYIKEKIPPNICSTPSHLYVTAQIRQMTHAQTYQLNLKEMNSFALRVRNSFHFIGTTTQQITFKEFIHGFVYYFSGT
jgi:hypothetical protein